ncbi:hypothetical protein JCM19301_565 [Jejuia pallidilutea]|uniref:Uncharacterized protein n=1 Tax=Jejuia pallidilutea TaxID=504487 RepID=A0A090VMN3_9FLAO|nr:hypothetical protein JCM19301_565 [Jejuia pallidilutea]
MLGDAKDSAKKTTESAKEKAKELLTKQKKPLQNLVRQPRKHLHREKIKNISRYFSNLSRMVRHS